MEKLNDEQIKEYLEKLNGWFIDNGSVKKIFNTRGFSEALGFVVSAGAICQKVNHHPVYINIRFKQVEISFSTHSAGGITLKDMEIADLIEKLPL